MGFPIPQTGAVTEDVAVTGGNLVATGDADVVSLKGGFDQSTAFTADTIAGAYGTLVIAADGVWSYTADNAQSAIQDLNDGDTLSEVFTVTTVFGDTTVSVTINGADEPPCFVRGTMIDTNAGPRPIETLQAGDQIVTADAGLQTIRWIGSKIVTPANVRDFDAIRPIRLQRDCFGAGVPDRDLMVSPMHRVLLQGAEPTLLFGQRQVLCAAKMLVNGETIVRDPAPTIEYFHMLFDGHQVVQANGCLAESFLPGNVGLSNFDKMAQEEIYEIFPQLRGLPDSYGPAARQILRQYEGEIIAKSIKPDTPFADRISSAA